MRPSITTTLRASALVALLAAVPAQGQANPGGAYASLAPSVQAVTCSEDCAELDSARPGSTVRVYGDNLDSVAAVAFLGADGRDDDVLAKPSKVRSRTVYVTVPKAARTGPVQVVNGDGIPSNVGPELAIDRGQTKTATGGGPGIDAQVSVRKAFVDGNEPIGLDYLVKGSAPTSVAVAVVRAADDKPVATWPARTVDPGTVEHLTWDGIVDGTSRSAPRGRYEFRVWTGATSGARAAQTPPTAVSSFLLIDNLFPVRGPHDFGSGNGRFGAGRTGHTHQGQDILADCGVPLVAARGGTVEFSGEESSAGAYIVIDGAGTGIDYAYMHMREPSPFKKGDRVRTGDQIGVVGRTGDATVCHLHFEEWSAPGWYSGGKPFDPLADLRAWDSFS